MRLYFYKSCLPFLKDEEELVVFDSHVHDVLMLLELVLKVLTAGTVLRPMQHVGVCKKWTSCSPRPVTSAGAGYF